MRDKERSKSLQVLSKRFPARYRELVEQYFRALAGGEKPPAGGDDKPKSDD